MRRPRAVRLAQLAFAAASPSLVMLAVVAILWRAGPTDFVPLWNDEIIYWNETAVFVRAGLEGGYVTVAEKPAAIPQSRFGPHGPFIGVVYGLIGRATGWRAYSGYLLHLVIVPLCALVWMLTVSRDSGLLGPSLFVATFWPLLLYLPTNMQEPLHFGFALLFAALCGTQTLRGWRGYLMVLLLGMACFARPTWALIIPALCWSRCTTWKQRATCALVTAVVLLVTSMVVTRMAAPYPYTSWIGTAIDSPFPAGSMLLRRLISGAQAYVQRNDDWYITALRVEVIVTLCIVAVLRRKIAAEHRWRLTTALLAIAPILLSLLVVADIESGREFRVIAPHLFVALLVLVPISPRWWKVPSVVDAVVVIALLPVFRDIHQGRFDSRDAVRRFSAAVSGRLEFRPGARSGWDNTILMHADALQPPVTGLPAGIGITYVLDWEDQSVPPRSRYLLLRERDQAFERRLSLKRIADTELGTVYENLDRSRAR